MKYSKQRSSSRETSNAIEDVFFNEEKPIGPMAWKIEKHIISIIESLSPVLRDLKVSSRYEAKISPLLGKERANISEYGKKSSEGRFLNLSTDLLDSIQRSSIIENAPSSAEVNYLMKSKRYS